ncbi:MAG: restriction endonuclease [Cytophagales bacterium]|nr:restriction endonuclease [Cytophagales bacterium]
MSSKNKGKDYELETKERYEELLRQDGVTETVEHSKKLMDSSAKKPAQVDVYWEFERAGILYRTAIECKDYKRPVSVDKIRAFASVLSDHKLNGIFVARNGFQSGAKEYAEAEGIELVELRKPKAEDLKGRIFNIHLRVEMWLPKLLHVNVEVHSSERSRYPEGKVQGRTYRGDDGVYDTKRNLIKSFNDMISALPRPPEDKNPNEELKHGFPFEGGYIKAGQDEFHRIERIQFRYSWRV